jgi:amino acid transporter
MKLIDRVRGMLLAPKAEWPKVADEPATVRSIIVGYVLILAALGPLATLVRGYGWFGPLAVTSYLMAIVITLALAWIVDQLAPSFGGEKNFVASLKLTAYSYTAAWVAGVAYLLPAIGAFVALAAAIYAFYTFYLGAPVLKKCAPDKAMPFTIVIVVAGIALGWLLSMLTGPMLAGMAASRLSMLPS